MAPVTDPLAQVVVRLMLDDVSRAGMFLEHLAYTPDLPTIDQVNARAHATRLWAVHQAIERLMRQIERADDCLDDAS
jgi:hypothetical protein